MTAATMDEINVIYQFNEKYVPFAGVSITSLLINNSKTHRICLHILGEGLSERSEELLAKTAERYGASIDFAATDDLISEFRDLGMIPYRGAYSVYLRLFFTRLYDFSGKRVLYLDADTVVDGDIGQLLSYDMGGRSIGMVLESITDDYKVMIGMDGDSEYFNSGVILYDTGRWQEMRYTEKLLDHIQNVRSSYIGDQDLINLVCEGDICRLPLEYNFQPLHARYTQKQYFGTFGKPPYYSAKEVEAAKQHPVIYHCYRWLGEFPWHLGNLHPFSAFFDKYMAESMWAGYEKKKAESPLALRIEKCLYILPRGLFIKIFRIAHEIMLKGAESDARHKRTNAGA
ncbi:MAG: glycosyltransferase family 8 protein [Lachnospiraceae bacterium]|nr:glycosyltransferase family 8 protein [Lachnospiraceae bacterium]